MALSDRHKKWMKRSLWGLGGLLLILILLMVGTVLYLRTDGGRDTLSAFLEDTISDPESGLEFAIDGLEGDPLGAFSVATLAVRQDGQTTVKANNITIAWHPLDLLRGTVRADYVKAASVDIFTPPESDEPPDPAAELLPSLPVNLDITDIGVETLRLEGVDPAFTLSGTLGFIQGRTANIDVDLSPRGDADEGVTLTIDYGVDDNVLSIDGDVKVKRDAPLGRFIFAEAPGDARLAISGRGPLSAWRGTATGTLNGDDIVKLFLGITRPDNHQVTIDGALDPALFLSDQTLARIIGPAALSTTIQLDGATPDAYVAVLSSPLASITLRGGLLTMEDLLASYVLLRSADTARLAPLVEGWQVGAFSVEGQLPKLQAGADGQDDLTTTLTFSIDDIAGAGMAPLSLDGALTLDYGTALAAQGSGTFRSRPAVKNDTLAGDWAVGMTYALETGRVDIDEFTVTSGRDTLALNGALTPSPLRANATARATIEDVARWQPFTGLAASGQVRLDADVAMSGDETGITGDITLAGRAMTFDDALLDHLLGSTPGISLNLDQPTRGAPNTLRLRAEGARLTATTDGTLDIGSETLDATYAVALNDTAAVLPIPGLQLDGTATGPFADLTVAARTRIAALGEGRASLNDIVIALDATNVPNGPTGTAEIDFTLDRRPVQGNASFAVDDTGGWQVDPITLTGEPLTVNGAVGAPPGKPATGALTITTARTDLWSTVAGFPLTALVNMDVTLADATGRQQIAVNAAATEISSWPPGRPETSARSATLSGSVTLGDTLAADNLNLTIRELANADITLSQIMLTAAPQGEGLRFNGTVDGDFKGPLSLRLAGDMQGLTGDVPTLSMTTLDGTIAEQPLALNDPVVITPQDDGISVAPFELQFGPSTLGGSGVYGDTTKQVRFQITRLDLDLMSTIFGDGEVSGMLDLNADVDLSTATPVGRLTLTIADLLMGDDLRQDPLGLTVESAFNDNALDTSLTLSTAGRYMLFATAALPISWVPDENAIDIAVDRPVKLDITGNAELDDLWPLAGQYDHTFSGVLATDLHLTGSLDQPQLTGTFGLYETSYRNLSTGLELIARRMGFEVGDGLLTLTPVTAGDGADGTITLSGWVRPFDPRGVTAELDGTLDKARVLNLRDISAKASGTLAYKRDLEAAALEADTTINEAEFKLTANLPQGIVPLDVTELNRPPGLVAVPGEPDEPGAQTSVAVTVAANNRIFVRGRGLESEWKGDIDVTGTLETPRLKGRLELIRGDFQFGGKVFEFEEGLIDFYGGETIDPVITARAVYEVPNLTAEIALLGPISEPSLSLSSRPELPDDEILARVMFGTTADSLSAIEAAQLAAAVASLTGGGGGFDVVGGIRKALTLERLEIGTKGDEGNSPLIRGGKYLTDNIYVEVGTASGDDDDGAAAAIDIELTKNLTVGTEATTSGNQSIRVRWNWNY